jgi:aldehyde dehydrogenase (NAD+)
MTDATAASIAERFKPSRTAKKLLIDGKLIDAASGRTTDTINPATGAHLASVAAADAHDVDLAVDAARRAFEGPWARFTPYERQQVLLKFADLVDANYDELCVLDTLSMGAPFKRMHGAKRRNLGLLRYNAARAVTIHGETVGNSAPGDILTYTLKEPVGVVGAIIPWNGPLYASIWKIAPVLASGCTMVFKPAEQASLCPLRLGELALEAGVPEGVINIITGAGRVVGTAIAEHPGIDKVAFTGSEGAGQAIVRASASNIKRLSLELGGKSPNIVFADADMGIAVPGAAMAVFENSGQVCSAGTRLFVERPIYEEFVSRVAEHGRRLRVGDGLDPETDLGPMATKDQLETVLRYFDIGRAEGARVVAGGDRPENVNPGGYFVSPTVFSDVRNDMRIAQEEIFGPVISAIPFDDMDDLAKQVNNIPFGLGSGVWSNSLDKVKHVTKMIQSGTVWVNCYDLMDPGVPFGGYKMSGYGRESGLQHIEEYLNVKAVWLNAPNRAA